VPQIEEQLTSRSLRLRQRGPRLNDHVRVLVQVFVRELGQLDAVAFSDDASDPRLLVKLLRESEFHLLQSRDGFLEGLRGGTEAKVVLLLKVANRGSSADLTGNATERDFVQA